MAWNDPATLNLVASLLIVVVMARAATERVRLDLWWFGVYALGATSFAVAGLLLAGINFQAGVFLFGVAAVAGAYWTAATRPPASTTRALHGVSVAAALGVAGLLAGVAVAYRWWVAPLTLLVLMGVGLVINGLIPLIQGWRKASPPAKATPPTSPLAAKGPQGAGTKPTGRPVNPVSTSPGIQRPPSAPARIAVTPARISVTCPACQLRGQIPASKAGQRVACPRCHAQVPVPAESRAQGTKKGMNG